MQSGRTRSALLLLQHLCHLACLDWVVWPGMDVTEDWNDSHTSLLALGNCASVNLDSSITFLLCKSRLHPFYGSKYCLKTLQLPVFIQYITFPNICLGKKNRRVYSDGAQEILSNVWRTGVEFKKGFSIIDIPKITRMNKGMVYWFFDSIIFLNKASFSCWKNPRILELALNLFPLEIAVMYTASNPVELGKNPMFCH